VPSDCQVANANHIAGRIHVHFAAEVRQVRHTPKPIKAAQTMLKMNSFQIIAVNE